jgi:hypothetical protein
LGILCEGLDLIVLFLLISLDNGRRAATKIATPKAAAAPGKEATVGGAGVLRTGGVSFFGR